jgi:hypothetical protein
VVNYNWQVSVFSGRLLGWNGIARLPRFRAFVQDWQQQQKNAGDFRLLRSRWTGAFVAQRAVDDL